MPLDKETKQLVAVVYRQRETTLVELAARLGRPLSDDEAKIAKAAYNFGRIDQMDSMVAELEAICGGEES